MQSFRWYRDLSDSETEVTYICQVHENAELAVEQFGQLYAQAPKWRTLMRRLDRSEAFHSLHLGTYETRSAAQEAAERFYSSQSS